MSQATPASALSGSAESIDQLSPQSRKALRDLILTLADNKRLLGIRYSDWMLGAPTLETGIAASSMAQDEWGHSRLTYALLSEFGEDPKQLEHGRDAPGYHNIDQLDSPLGSWAELIASNLLLDTALTVQYGALVNSRYVPVHNRVQKLLDEEEYHFQYGAGWAQRLAAAEGIRPAFRDALAHFLAPALRWLGRPDSEATNQLIAEELVRADPDTLRQRYLARVAPVLAAAGLTAELGLEREDSGWRYAGELHWDGWNDTRRRVGDGGPDEETLARVRGDKNRAMLLE